MPVKVVNKPDTLTATTFTFVVPAGEIWSLRTVVAFAARGVGGIPNRAYRLDITNGTNIVSAFGALDGGAEPGSCEITWGGVDSDNVAVGNVGVTDAPMKVDRLPTGYQIIGTILGAVAGDTWFSALVWCDFVNG